MSNTALFLDHYSSRSSFLCVNYANIPWASTCKSKFQRLNCCQKDTTRAVYHKDR